LEIKTKYMTDLPLVTIIMAVKDTAIYLHECIDSIINQTYPNWELIAVNDHSSDGSDRILKAYAAKDERIRFYNSNQPKLIPTLQLGYAKTKGTLINRMDSDDRMPLDKLQVLVAEWNKYGKGTVIAGGTEHFVDEGEVGGGFLNYEKWLNKVARTSTHYQEIYKECVIPSHCWILHKEDFDAVGAFDPIIYPEDYDLCFRFYKKGLQVVGINKILDRDRTRPLVVWGAGKNGKDVAKLLQLYTDDFYWVCDNQHKIGKDIYDIRIKDCKDIPILDHPQIIIVVSSPDGKIQIRELLDQWNKKPVVDFWFFV